MSSDQLRATPLPGARTRRPLWTPPPGAAHGSRPEIMAAVRWTVESVLAGTHWVRVRHSADCASAATSASAAQLAALIGDDAARYALIRQARHPAAPLEIGRWVPRTDDNPAFLVRHAHARLAVVARYATALGYRAVATPDVAGSVPDELPSTSGDGTAGTRLRTTIEEYPAVLANAAGRNQPHRLTRYLERLAGVVRGYELTVRILPAAGVAPALVRERLTLVAAARVVLADGLGVLGVNAPERM